MEERTFESFDELEAYLAAESSEIEDQADATPKPKFVVENITQANWAVAKISGRAQDRNQDLICRDEQIARGKALIEQANAWFDGREKARGRSIGYLMTLLKTFALGLYENSKGKVKTTKLPCGGEIQVRQPMQKLVFTDLDKSGEVALAFLNRFRPELVKVVHSIKMKELAETVAVKMAPGNDAIAVEIEIIDVNGEVRKEEIPGLQAEIGADLRLRVKVGDKEQGETTYKYEDLFTDEPVAQEGGAQ